MCMKQGWIDFSFINFFHKFLHARNYGFLPEKEKLPLVYAHDTNAYVRCLPDDKRKANAANDKIKRKRLESLATHSNLQPTNLSSNLN